MKRSFAPGSKCLLPNNVMSPSPVKREAFLVKHILLFVRDLRGTSWCVRRGASEILSSELPKTQNPEPRTQNFWLCLSRSQFTNDELRFTLHASRLAAPGSILLGFP